MDDRIVELEIRITYQDKLLADLDEVVQLLAKQVERQERELQQLKEMMAEQPAAVGPSDDKPPHY
jgi:SlyX protein